MSEKCPKCGEKNNLMHTWDGKTNEYERLKCFDCGGIWTKDELRILELESVIEARDKEIARLRKALEDIKIELPWSAYKGES